LAWLWFDVLRFRRALILSNLRRAFASSKSEQALIAIGRASVKHVILVFFEFFYSERHDIAGEIEWVGQEYLNKALEEGKGAYVLCCHLGNWEAMGARYSRDVAPTHVIIKELHVTGMNRYMQEGRDRNGFRYILRQEKGDAFRQMGDVLQRNELIGFVMDQARPGSPKLPFFGVPAKTNTSFAAIWRRLPAPIIPAFAVREGFNRHKLVVMPALSLETTEDEDADILNHSQQFNSVVESMIIQKPELYLWMHNRWK